MFLNRIQLFKAPVKMDLRFRNNMHVVIQELKSATLLRASVTIHA